MTKKITTDKYFEIIKQNHKKYLEQNMVTHLELTGGLKQAELVKKYAERISEFRSSKERTLNNALQPLRAMEGRRPRRVVPDRPRFTESARRDV